MYIKNYLANFSIGEKLIILLFLTLPFERVLTWEFLDFTVKPPYLSGLILVAYYIHSLITKKVKLHLGLAELLLLAFVIFSFATTIWSIDQFKTMVISSMFAFVALISLGTKTFIQSKNIDRFYTLFIYLGLFSAFFGIWQFFGDMLGVPVQYTLIGEDYVKGVFPFPRAQSTYFEPLFFANFLLIPLFFSLYLFHKQRSKFLLVSLYTLSLAFFLTLSRGGIVAYSITLLLVAIAVLIWQRQVIKSLFYYSLTLIAAFATALVIIFSFTGKEGVFSYFGQASNSIDMVEYSEVSKRSVTRSYTMKVAMDTWLNRPFGVGNGAFGSLEEFDWVVEEQGNKRQTVNSLYPEILVELGIIGLVLFIGFLASVIYRIIKKSKKIGLRELVVLAVILAIFIQYISFSTLYLIYLWVFLGLAMKNNTSE